MFFFFFSIIVLLCRSQWSKNQPRTEWITCFCLLRVVNVCDAHNIMCVKCSELLNTRHVTYQVFETYFYWKFAYFFATRVRAEFFDRIGFCQTVYHVGFLKTLIFFQRFSSGPTVQRPLRRKSLQNNRKITSFRIWNLFFRHVCFYQSYLPTLFSVHVVIFRHKYKAKTPNKYCYSHIRYPSPPPSLSHIHTLTHVDSFHLPRACFVLIEKKTSNIFDLNPESHFDFSTRQGKRLIS